MQKVSRSLAALLILMTTLTFTSLFTPPALADNASTLATQIAAVGLSASVDGNTVTVTGTTAISKALVLSIDPDVIIDWQAELSGPVNAAYLIVLKGSGTFEVSSCTISNPGTGGAINIHSAGAGTTVTVNSGGALLSDRGGNSILVEAVDATVNVNEGGAVRSLSNNTNAAIQVNNILGAKININNGSVISDTGGYAINDGAGTGNQNNNTAITINGGVVSSGSACAIHSTGINSVVKVTDGVVTNSAASNSNPTIYMNGDNIQGFTNIIISGGAVQNIAANPTSYAIQTTNDIEISGGGVFTYAGRAINLVGMYSTATVSGGTVQAIDSGTAICTATTNPASAAGASVVVKGGTVSATSGYAIRVTGENSQVYASGGTVQASSGNAIQADPSAKNSNITVTAVSSAVHGALVYAISGYAIRNDGANSTVTVSDRPDGLGGAGGPGAQVYVLKASSVIRSNGTVTVNGGLVFAFGAGAVTAISAPTINWPLNGVGGVVGVWNQAVSQTSYTQVTSPHLTATTGGPPDFRWYFNHLQGSSGIDYHNGRTAGYFPLPSVSVAYDHGLIFDSQQGIMYVDKGNGVKGEVFNLGRDLFNPAQSLWTPAPGVLTLNGFSWSTAAETALTIIGRDTKIILNKDSTFAGPLCGVKSDGCDITIAGHGALTAKARPELDSRGIDLGGGTLFIEDGRLIAQGHRAIGSGINNQGPVASYYRWTYSESFDGSNATSNYGWNDPFEYFATDQYVMFETLQHVELLSAVQIGGASRMADTTDIMLFFDREISGLTADDIVITGPVVKGALTGAGKVWVITLDSVDEEGTVNVEVKYCGSYYVDPNEQLVDVYKADLHSLTIIATEGGTVSGDNTGNYLAGMPIEATAAANSGYRFSGWSITGAFVSDDVNPAQFYMPEQEVILTANFEPIPEPEDPDPEDADDCGLIFDAATGELYLGNPDHPVRILAPGEGMAWAGAPQGTENPEYPESPGVLMLYGFSWVTAQGIALTVINGDTVIVLAGDNLFKSIVGISSGIKSEDWNITIAGSGTLTANGGEENGSYGIDLGEGGLSLVGGTFTAIGAQAIKCDDTSPKAAYYRWEFAGNGSNAGIFPDDAEFEFFDTDNYVRFQTLEPIYFDAVQTGGESGLADSTGIELTFSQRMSGLGRQLGSLPEEGVTITNDTGAVAPGALISAVDTWTVELNSVSAEGIVHVMVEHFDNYYIEPRMQDVEVYKDTLYNLTVTAGANGAITANSTTTGQYHAGTPIEVAAVADSGYRFTQWTVVSYINIIADNTTNPAVFLMPDNAVTLTAKFEIDPDDGGDGGNGGSGGNGGNGGSGGNGGNGGSGGNSGNSGSDGNKDGQNRKPDDDGKDGDDDKDTPVTTPDNSPFITGHVAYITSDTDGRIGPGRNITRAEVATVFYRLLTDEIRAANRTQQNPFSDVNAGSLYHNAVSVMDKMEIIKGYPDGTFRPDGTVTRAELATIAARFARQMRIETHNTAIFNDIAAHWAATDIKYAAEIGWVNGYPSGTFAPNQKVTRAEFMTLVNRMMGRVPEMASDILADQMTSWADNADVNAWYYLAVQEATNSHEPEFKEKTVPGLRFKYERWVKMIENRDWTLLEKD